MTNAALHNRIVNILIDPAYAWTSSCDFFDEVRRREPEATNLDIVRAGIEVLELRIEQIRAMVTAFRPRGNESPVFDEQLSDLQAAVAGVWLAFTPEGDGRAVQARFNLSERQTIDALERSTRMLGAPR
ncbi:MAG: hypothetical protein J0I79_14870 [Mesorhizobium sp.]|uniref:hypothetical protein n=1 Tax=Mesorhizobium sp. TaxID=1871066 RepID=UPI001AC56AC3|nr:hypothetical protein [Mesorhizobium sp.]MBN9219232.1 hypothetical protein [Mesorhizobium sp.]